MIGDVVNSSSDTHMYCSIHYGEYRNSQTVSLWLVSSLISDGVNSLRAMLFRMLSDVENSQSTNSIS